MIGRARTAVIIVGGGASGVLMAANLLKLPRPDLRVTLIEKRPFFGQGVAYSATLSDHLLNVSALGMSAYDDDREHFARWLEEKGHGGAADPSTYFAPRRLYGEYLGELLETLQAREKDTGRLHLVQEEALSVAPASAGVEVRLANGASIVGRAAVLAIGHDEEPAPEQSFAVRIGSSADSTLASDARVMILGTGLSMVDAFLTLEHHGHRGEVVAVSRRGLLPSPHRQGNPIRLDVADIPLGTELSYFVGWLRDLIRERQGAGGDWRDVVDGMRPFNQKIWQNWPASAKRRFLEHTKAWWDIHRHRMPPQIHSRISQAVNDGRIRLVAGRIVDVHPLADSLAVSLQPRHAQATEILDVARIYDCTGITKDVSAGSMAVVRSLIDAGFARPDSLRLGLDVTQQCALISEAGIVSDRLFAVGPLTRGTFFEIDSLPDIRAQCAALALSLVA